MSANILGNSNVSQNGSVYFSKLAFWYVCLYSGIKIKKNMVNKSKAILITGCGSLLRCETLRIADFLDSWLTDGGVAVSLMGQPCFTSHENSWCSFLLEAVNLRASVVGRIR
jgi:hypothetical protein